MVHSGFSHPISTVPLGDLAGAAVAGAAAGHEIPAIGELHRDECEILLRVLGNAGDVGLLPEPSDIRFEA